MYFLKIVYGMTIQCMKRIEKRNKCTNFLSIGDCLLSLGGVMRPHQTRSILTGSSALIFGPIRLHKNKIQKYNFLSHLHKLMVNFLALFIVQVLYIQCQLLHLYLNFGLSFSSKKYITNSRFLWNFMQPKVFGNEFSTKKEKINLFYSSPREVLKYDLVSFKLPLINNVHCTLYSVV